MKRSGIRENPGFRPDGLHPGYRVFIQILREIYAWHGRNW
jgi:hypothetical protein